MMQAWSPLLTKKDFPSEFIHGLNQFRDHDWEAANASFRLVGKQSRHSDIYRNLYVSYYGLSLVCMNDPSGLNFCRRAAADELFVADVFANLAKAEIRLKHRRQAHAAVCRGLKINAGHPGLRNLRLLMGSRRSPLVPFLGRNHFLNRLLGKLTYRGRSAGGQPFRGRML